MERLRSNIPPGLVVIEVKSFDAYLNDQFPEGVGELYAFAKSLGSAHAPSISGFISHNNHSLIGKRPFVGS